MLIIIRSNVIKIVWSRFHHFGVGAVSSGWRIKMSQASDLKVQCDQMKVDNYIYWEAILEIIMENWANKVKFIQFNCDQISSYWNKNVVFIKYVQFVTVYMLQSENKLLLHTPITFFLTECVKYIMLISNQIYTSWLMK